VTRLRAFVVLLCLLPLAAGAAGAAETPIPPSPARWATDAVGFVSPGTLQAVDSTLEAFERSTGNQVLVWIGDTTGGVPVEDWAVRAFASWKVGRKGFDNGVVLFILAGDRKVRIEVGYGLEGQVPDAAASRIVNDTIIPRIQAGDRDGAVLAGMSDLLAQIRGEAPAAAPGAPVAAAPGDRGSRPSQGRPMTIGEKIIGGLLVLGFLVLLVTNPQLAIWLLFSILSSGRGGGGGGGGGFSGGGGRSGGGGASGSW
jgi:uncharacterized protein